MMLAWDHWHIEPSSICTLKCPRCPRAEVPESLLNRQLSLEFFQTQIGADTVKQIRKITFCGNDGDPIYCRDFLEIIAWIKSVNPNIHLVIITNGSYKPRDWWHRLGAVLDQQDEIHWSIDGWDQESNQQYRVNSDWSSIIAGIQAFSESNTDTYRVWATIAFKFNQNHLDYITHLAKMLDMDLWQLTKSTKFGSHYPETYGVEDSLCPDRRDLISATHRFERALTLLTDRMRPGAVLKEVFFQRAQDLAKHKQYSGICFIGNKGVFLDSQGRFFPCCWTANRYAHNQHWHELAHTRFDLNTRTFEQILTDPFWSTDFLRFDSHECRTKCTPDRLADREHTTEW